MREALTLLAGQVGESFSCYWGIHKSFLGVNSLLSDASMCCMSTGQSFLCHHIHRPLFLSLTTFCHTAPSFRSSVFSQMALKLAKRWVYLTFEAVRLADPRARRGKLHNCLLEKEVKIREAEVAFFCVAAFRLSIQHTSWLFLRSRKQSEEATCSRAAGERPCASGEHRALSVLHVGLPACTGVSLPPTPRNQFGGTGAAVERESPLPSAADTSYHGRELKRDLWVRQWVRPRGSPGSFMTSILTQNPGRPWISPLQKANSAVCKTDPWQIIFFFFAIQEGLCHSKPNLKKKKRL